MLSFTTFRQLEVDPASLPLAPRFPFLGFSAQAIEKAAAWTEMLPEKHGIFSRYWRRAKGISEATIPVDAITIEAHFDAADVPPELADRLMEIGFELDGFAKFEPAHFTDHHTFKVTLDARDTAHRQMLREVIKRQCVSLMNQLAREWPDIDAYLELEIYSSRNRRSWGSGAIEPDAGELPYAPGAFTIVLPACDVAGAAERGLPLDLGKRADLHLKIARDLSPDRREAMIARLEAIGFYRVLTWAGNHICTAQFARASDAKNCFKVLASYFDKYGGCSELTMEPVARMWRSGEGSATTAQLGTLPPLVTRIDFAR